MRNGTFSFRNRAFGSRIYVEGDVGMVIQSWLVTSRLYQPLVWYAPSPSAYQSSV